MRILVATQAIDMRKGIDSIAALCRHILQEDPMSGAMFMFISRSRKNLRILTYDGQGFWLITKRLSQGRFPYWPTTGEEQQWLRELEACEAQVLLHAGDPRQVRHLESWKKIKQRSSFLPGVS